MYNSSQIRALAYLLGAIASSILTAVGMPLAGAILCAIAAFGFCYAETTARRAGVVHLDIFFVLAFAVYSLNVPIFVHLTPKDLSLDLVNRGLFICTLCHFGLAVGFMFVRFVPPAEAGGRPPDRYSLTPRQMYGASYTLFFIGLAMSFVAVVLTVGFEAYLSAGYAGRALLKRDAGPIEIGLYVCATSLVTIFCVRQIYQRRGPFEKIFLYSALALFVAYVAFLGIRRPIFLLIGGLFAGYSVIYFRPSVVRSSLIVIPIFLVLSSFAQYRQIISSEGTDATINFIRDNASISWLDFSDNELGAPFRTLYDELPNIDREGFLYGGSYLSVPGYMLPSAINGGVESLSMKYTERYFDPRFISIGGNMGYFSATEAYYNFGYIGCIAMFAIMSFLLGNLNRRFFQIWRGTPLAISFYSILIPWVAFFIRLDFGSFAKSYFYSQFICFPMLYMLAQVFSAKSGSRGGRLDSERLRVRRDHSDRNLFS